MDKETLEKLGGTISWIEVPYTTTGLSVTTGKDRWQSIGSETIVCRVEVGSEADPQAVFNATREWLKLLAIDANKDVLANLNTAYKAYHQGTPKPPEPVLRDAPKKEAAQPSDGTVPGDLTFPVETLSVEVKGGKRYVKAKGGNFKMYGVNVWPEVLALPPLEWVADELDGADYPAPAGLTAIYVEKTINAGTSNEKVVPDKVTGWA